MKRIVSKPLLYAINALIALLFLTTAAYAQRTASVSGNWNSTATWGGSAVPTSTDAVTIANGITVTVNVSDAVCASVQIGNANGTAVLQFNASSQLTVSGVVTVGQNSGGTNRFGQLTMTSGGNLICRGLAVGFSSSSNTFTPGSGTVELTATNTLPSSTFTSFNTLNITGGTTTLGRALSISALTIGSGTTFTPGSNLITLSGDLVNNGTVTSGSGGLTISGTATQSVGSFTTTGTVSMTKTAGTATFTRNISGAGLTINGTGGTLNLGTGLNHTFSSTWTRTAGTLNGGSSTMNLSATSSTISGTGGTFTAGTGTVNYSGSGSQTLALLAYNNLLISGSGNKTIGATTTISQNFSIQGTAKAILNAGTDYAVNSLTLGAAGSNSGTWGSTSSTATNKTDTYFTTTTGTVTVSSDTRAAATVTPTIGTYNYTGSAQGPNSVTTGSTGAVTYSYEGVSPTVYTASATRPTDIGSYTVTASVQADNNYLAGVSSATAFSIGLGVPIVTPTIGSYTYYGSAQGPDAATNTGTGTSYTYSYVGVSGTSYTASSTKPTNAGSYTVTATVAADGNYGSASSSATAFTIARITPTVTPIIGTYAYTGSQVGPNTATNTGTGTSYTYRYVGVSPTVYSSSSTRPTNPGSYTVTVTVAQNGNYEQASSSATAFIITPVSPMTYSTKGSGSFTVPAGVSCVMVQAWGSGGGGSAKDDGGGGGGGGAYASSVLTLTSGNSYTFYIGDGGSDGVAGEATTFNSTDIIAAGGSSNNSTSSTGSTGAVGGTIAASTGTVKYAGGSGGNGAGGGSSKHGGGGGGGSATSSANGSNGSSTSNDTGASGGSGEGAGGKGGNSGGSGSSGTSPGGGGGGNGNNGSSDAGNGAVGRIILTWVDASNFSSSASATTICAQSASAVTITSTSLSNGTYTVTYNLSGTNTATGSTATMSFSGGTGTFNTSALSNSGSTTITITNITFQGWSCSASISSNNEINLTINSQGQWLGLTSEWNTAGNWCGGVPTSASDVTINSGVSFNPIVNASTPANCKNLTINSGASVDANSGTLNVYGNWTNNGSFNGNTGNVVFKGAAQSVGGSNPSSFYDMTIDGAGSKTLSQPITVTHALTFTQGYIIADATNKVIIADNANVAGASDASFVLGPIQKIGSTGLTDATFTFPSGKSSGSVYEPVQIKFLAASSTMAFTVDHYTSVAMSGNLDVAVAANKDANAKKMNYIPTDEYWDISNDEADGSKLSTSGVDVTIHYHNTNVDLTTYKYILHHTGTLWEVPNRTNQTAFAGLNAGSAIKIPAQKSFSPFTIGGSASALPVTLMNFTAKATPERTAALNWATESESLNKGFAIERQASNVNGKYERIGYVASRAINGNSQTALYYNFIDMHPGTGETVFYRLAQEDMDGKISYTEVRVVKFNGQTVSMIYPNPSTGLINISRTANGSKMNIQVTDMSGKLIQQINNVTDSNYKLNINYSGMYNIKLIYPETGEQTIQKIVVQK